MFCILKTKEYVSKHKPEHEKQIILLMIQDIENWYYIAVIKLFALLTGVTSKYNDDFIVWIVSIHLE